MSLSVEILTPLSSDKSVTVVMDILSKEKSKPLSTLYVFNFIPPRRTEAKEMHFKCSPKGRIGLWALKQTYGLERALEKNHGLENSVAQTHKMANTITGSAINSGTTCETPRLGTTAEMSAARTDISGVFSKLEGSLKRLGITLMASDATFITIGNTDVVSMTAGNSGLASMMVGGSNVESMFVNRLWCGSHIVKRLLYGNHRTGRY
ncbi:hypothetical protein DPX16_17431 [Anabarilius grahami]|uniref:Uncharacterized protein n=1 Tax=Anabarilius grahami TaxID=495550 RepID=A0A3N0XYY7_ANAGA|nr:hypothetical protein DPX16_17431 [Anabarilius grahami]